MSASTISILALGFGSPAMLFGLGAASIPIIIHLLHKRRYKETRWAAMKFLAEAARKQSRRLRWEQLIVLLVRCLAVMMLATAFSRPFFESAFSSVSGRDPRHIIVVLDNSFSMSQRVGNETRLEQGKDAVRQLVTQGMSGDGYSLICLTQALPSDLTAPTYRQDSFLAELEAVPATEFTADLSDTFVRLESLIRNSSEPRNKEILIVSDFQQRDWDPAGAARDAITSRISRVAGDNVRFTFLDVGGGPMGNFAVADLTIEPQPILAGQTSTITATVLSFADEPFENVNLELQIDERTIATTPVIEAQSDTAKVSFRYTWQEKGDHQLVARLLGDRLEVDNQRFHVATIRDSLRVLLVEGRPAEEVRERSSHYLETALETVMHPVSREPLFAITTTDAIGFAESAAQAFDVIALCNLRALTANQLLYLQSHLLSGGGLLLVHGSELDAELWMTRLDQLMEENWPIRLEDAAVPGQGNTEEIWGFLSTELTHPVVKPFSGNPGTGLDSAVVWERANWTIESENRTRPVLLFDDGVPAIVEVILPRGRCLQMAMSCDAGSGSWAPLSGSFPPIAIEMFQFLSIDQNPNTQQEVGKALSGVIPGERFVSEVSITDPQGERFHREPFDTGEGQGLPGWEFSENNLSGFYSIDFGQPALPSQTVAVNVDPVEGDLTRVSKESIQEKLFRDHKLSLQIAPTINSGEVTTLQESPISRWLLWLGIALLAVEVAMVWEFRVGLAVLLAVVIVTGVVTLSSWIGPAPAIAGGVLISCLLLLMILQRVLLARKRKQHRSLFRVS